MPSRPNGQAPDPETEAVLSTLGLSSTERRTYLYLLEAVSGQPTEVARETGQSRGRIYETLRSLVAKGLVREEPSRPVRYLPVPLPEVVAVALANTHHRIQRLRRLGAELVEKAPAARALGRQDISVFTGRRAVTREQRRMLDEAERHFVLWGGGRLAERLVDMPEILEAIRTAQQRGVHVEVILPYTAESAPARTQLESEIGGALRTFAPDTTPHLVHAATEREALLAVVQPDDASAQRGEDVAVGARGLPFAEAALHHVRLRIGPSASVSPAAAQRPYPVADLDPERVGLKFLESLAGTHEEILGMGPSGWSRFLERGWEATVGVYAAAKRRGVRFRALTTDTPHEREHVARFGALWEVRVAGWIPAWLIVVDRRELFQAFSVGPDEEAPHLRHSTDAREVRFYVDLFERLWARSRPLEEPVAKREGSRR